MTPHGLDILGATMPRVIQIRVRNGAEVAAKRGGAGGAIAAAIAPQTIAAKVEEEMAKEMARGLRQQGVVADVSLVEDTGAQPASGGSDFASGVAVGAGALGVVYALYRLARTVF